MQLPASWLTLFEPRVPEPGAAREDLYKSEGIVAVTLTIIAIERFAYPLLPPRNEIPRRKRGYQKMSAVREYLD